MILLHPRTDVPLPSALFAPLNIQGSNNSPSPQRGERPGGCHVTNISQSAHNIM